MKDDRISELFSANIDRLYAAAKEKHGERAEAALCDAVRKTAGKFKKLGEKAYVTLLLQELGVSAFYQNEEPAPGGLVAAIESAFAEGLAKAKKKSRLFAILGGAAAVVCIAVAVGFALRPGAAPSGATTIEGAKEYTSGDFVLSNVHTINDYTGFDGEFTLSVKNESKYQSSSTVAPDGTVYLLTVCETNAETETDTVGLYQMTAEGWEELCTFEQKYSTKPNALNPQEKTRFYTRNFVFCDAESRPFIFLYDMVDGNLLTYMYNHRTEKTEAVTSIPVQVRNLNGMAVNIVACADGQSVYFGCSSGGSWADFLIFDLKTKTFRQNGEILSGSSIFLNAITHKDDCTYLIFVDSVLSGGDSIYLYSFRNFAEEKQELVFYKELYAGRNLSVLRNYDGVSVLADENGKVYAFFTFRGDQVGSPAEYALEIVSSEGESLTSKRYKALEYPSFPQVTGSRGIFMGADGTLYFIEDYDVSSVKQLCIGTFTGEDYDNVKEVASFNAVETNILLQPQYISDPTGEEGLFVDLLGVSSGDTSMSYGYMRLRLN